MMMMEQEQHQEQSGSLNFVPKSNIATSISQDGQNSNQNQTQTQTPIPSTAVGLILLKNGSLFSFGLLPPSVEARATPHPEEWIEIKICPPSHLFELPATAVTKCPAEYCNEKSRSHEVHVRKHLSRILDEQKMNNTDTDIPSSLPIRYYCNESMCYSGLQMFDQSRGFSKMRYLKQHYLKIHAPKTFGCTICNKSFSTLALLGGHMKSCGNSFECFTCSKRYNTLEALQTHCRRNRHSLDYSQYKDVIDNAKNKISALRKAEQDMKQKQPLPIQVISPRPKTITCGPGGNPSHVIWTYDCGIKNPKVKTETCTQTDTETPPTTESLRLTFSNTTSSKSRLKSCRLEGRKRSAETQTGKSKYKVSTEAQTLNVTKRRRASKKQIAEAETQCYVNVVNPQQQHKTMKNMKTASTSRNDSDEISTSTISPKTTAVITLDEDANNDTTTTKISLEEIMSNVGIVEQDCILDGEEEEQVITAPTTTTAILENAFTTASPSSTSNLAATSIVNVLDQEFENGVNGYCTTSSGGVSTSEVSVGFDFDDPCDHDLEDFIRYELTRETQTDATPPEFVGLPDPYFNEFNNTSFEPSVVTTETQTSFINFESDLTNNLFSSMDMDSFLSSSAFNSYNNANSNTEDWNNPLNSIGTLNTYSSSSSTMLNCEDGMIFGQERNKSPSYLETIDGETQTTFPCEYELPSPEDDAQFMDCFLPSVFQSPSSSNK